MTPCWDNERPGILGQQRPKTPQEEAQLSKPHSEKPNFLYDQSGKKRRLQDDRTHLPPVRQEDEMGI